MDEPYSVSDLAEMGLIEDADGEWVEEAESLNNSPLDDSHV